MQPSNRQAHTWMPRSSRAPSNGDSLTKRNAYDRESGVVYTEYEVSAGRKRNFDWTGELKTPSLVRRVGPNKYGARSLREIAIISCAKEIRNLTPEHLVFVPWSIAEHLWHKIENDRSESFHIWRTFAIAYGTEFANRHNRYMLDIRSPSLPHLDYYQGINSPRNDWLTALRISPKQTMVQDMIGLSSITNLVILDLSDGQKYVEDRRSNFEERVMRTWAELASAGRAFQQLRVLLLGWQEYLDGWLFRYLEYFPELESVLVTDCRSLHQKNRKDWEPLATRAGWEALHAKRSVKTLRPLLNDDHFYVGNISSCYYESINHYKNSEAQDGSLATNELPILECWIGTPKAWTHVIDDFPSTRTIWFQRKSQARMTPNNMVVRAETPNSSSDVGQPTGIRLPKSVPSNGTRKLKPTKHDTTSLLTEFGI